MHSLIECVEILYGYISSDHYPLAMTLNICLQSQCVNVDKPYGTPSFSNWNNISSNYKYCYFLESGELLSNINLLLMLFSAKILNAITLIISKILIVLQQYY